MSDIGIIGYGIVGKAVEYGFKNENNRVLYYDKYKVSDRLKHVMENSMFIFICLPTPYKNDRIDLSIIDDIMEEIARLCNDTEKIIIIKSSVVPGTTRKYAQIYSRCRFCFNPEFLTEANYLEDFVNADRIILGADDDKISLAVTDLYRNRFPNISIFRTDLTTAEMVKYMANCLLATKVIFANEMYDLCEKLGIKYEEVKNMVIADSRIGKTHLDVTSLRGFGGKCFPANMISVIGLYKELGIDCSLLETVWNKNLRIRKIKDWEEIPFVKSE